MEPLLFFVLICLFWPPAFILLIAGFFSFKLKRLRKTLFILSTLTFSIPLLLAVGVRISDRIEMANFEGIYYGKDIRSNDITVEITSDQKFSIHVDNCNQADITGGWQYVSEYDTFLFYSKGNKISINENYRDELILTSDISSDCCNLTEVKLLKK